MAGLDPAIYDLGGKDVDARVERGMTTVGRLSRATFQLSKFTAVVLAPLMMTPTRSPRAGR
jgi:hypothetical protein